MQRQKQKRYSSDVTDKQWAIIKSLIPLPKSKRGRPRKTEMRDTVNAIFYLVRTGCQWRMLPKDFPSWPNVYYQFRKWKKDGTWKNIHDALRTEVRKKAGKKT